MWINQAVHGVDEHFSILLQNELQQLRSQSLAVDRKEHNLKTLFQLAKPFYGFKP